MNLRTANKRRKRRDRLNSEHWLMLMRNVWRDLGRLDAGESLPTYTWITYDEAGDITEQHWLTIHAVAPV